MGEVGLCLRLLVILRRGVELGLGLLKLVIEHGGLDGMEGMGLRNAHLAADLVYK